LLCGTIWHGKTIIALRLFVRSKFCTENSQNGFWVFGVNMVNKIAVIGDKDSVLAFQSVGVEVFDATTPAEAQALVKKLSQEQYAVLFLAENLAEKIPDVLEKAKTKPFPAIVPIPTTAQSSGFGMQGIKKDVEKAIGVDIIFNKEDK